MRKIINDLYLEERLNLVVKTHLFFFWSKTQLVFVENCIENKGFMVGYCKHKRGNFPSYLQIAI